MSYKPLVYALQTARDNSKSVKNKNILRVRNIPLYMYNFNAAKQCKDISDVYISTNIKKILNDYPNNTIDRPKELCTDTSPHYDTILHGLNCIEEKINKKLDILVILLGNNKGANPKDLHTAIQKCKNYDSVISVGKYNMFNPYRAYKNKNGVLETYIDQNDIKERANKNHNDKNAFGDVYFFNGSFWVCKREAIINNNGLLPFPWLGNKIYPIVQNPNIMEIDDVWQISIVCS